VIHVASGRSDGPPPRSLSDSLSAALPLSETLTLSLLFPLSDSLSLSDMFLSVFLSLTTLFASHAHGAVAGEEDYIFPLGKYGTLNLTAAYKEVFRIERDANSQRRATAHPWTDTCISSPCAAPSRTLTYPR
jgi:hypothetical protein